MTCPGLGARDGPGRRGPTPGCARQRRRVGRGGRRRRGPADRRPHPRGRGRGRLGRARARLFVERRSVQLGGRALPQRLGARARRRRAREPRAAGRDRPGARVAGPCGVLGQAHQPGVRPPAAVRRLGRRPDRAAVRPAPGPLRGAGGARRRHGGVRRTLGRGPRAPHPQVASRSTCRSSTTTRCAGRRSWSRTAAARPWWARPRVPSGASCGRSSSVSASSTAAPASSSRCSWRTGRFSSGPPFGKPRRAAARFRKPAMSALPARMLVDLPNWLGDFVHALPALAALRAANRGGETAALLPAAHAPLARLLGVNAIARPTGVGFCVGAAAAAAPLRRGAHGPSQHPRQAAAGRGGGARAPGEPRARRRGAGPGDVRGRALPAPAPRPRPGAGAARPAGRGGGPVPPPTPRPPAAPGVAAEGAARPTCPAWSPCCLRPVAWRPSVTRSATSSPSPGRWKRQASLPWLSWDRARKRVAAPLVADARARIAPTAWALDEIAALLAACDAAVGNDSGLTHLAAASRLPDGGAVRSDRTGADGAGRGGAGAVRARAGGRGRRRPRRPRPGRGAGGCARGSRAADRPAATGSRARGLRRSPSDDMMFGAGGPLAQLAEQGTLNP